MSKQSDTRVVQVNRETRCEFRSKISCDEERSRLLGCRFVPGFQRKVEALANLIDSDKQHRKGLGVLSLNSWEVHFLIEAVLMAEQPIFVEAPIQESLFY